jgi:transposase
MRQKSARPNSPSERLVKNIRRATRKQYSAEEKIRIVLDGLRGESSIAELCRREGIAEGLYYSWSKAFLEAICSHKLTKASPGSCYRLPSHLPLCLLRAVM